MSVVQADVPALTDRLLADIADQLGRPVPARYAAALRAVPRHLFLPDRLWLRDGTGGYRPCDRNTDPDDWWTAAYTDTPLVTQFSDHAPSSSASMPSMVLRTLLLADAPRTARTKPGAVLELGTGTGFNAALLCALYGQDHVTTVELDPVLADEAEANLKAAGHVPAVVTGDASVRLPDRALFDLMVATFSTDHVPDLWRERCRPGGQIVTPWFSDWCVYGTLALVTTAGHRAEGRFHPFGSYMPVRTSTSVPASNTPPEDSSSPSRVRSTTSLSPWAVAGGDLDAEFHLGLTVPRVSFAWDSTGEHAPIRLWLHGADGVSVASVDYDGHQSEEFAVVQEGPRQLWDETTAAYARWERLGRPPVDRHGLTVCEDGVHQVWIDAPEALLTRY
ncbi:methyltransferase domain-containing protein [Streptomyces sp. NPDC050485]|uniref:methyltransferase domain-containing protein n=1 Tax=Streptomyces sp. NPDC050485 TaxID=3365617 RepID=UPI00379C3101